MRNAYYQMDARDVHCRRTSEGIKEPLHVVMIAKQVEHDHVFLRLGEHDAASLTEAQLKDAA